MKNHFRTSFLIVFLGLTLTACISVTTDQGISALQGESLDTAINLIGPPDEKKIINGRTFYVWSSSYAETKERASTASNNKSTSNIEAIADLINGINSDDTYTEHYYCKLTLEVNQQNRIIAWNRRSNSGGCREYYDKLKALYLAKKVGRKI